MKLDEIIAQMELNETADEMIDWERLAKSKKRLKQLNTQIRETQDENYELGEEEEKLGKWEGNKMPIEFEERQHKNMKKYSALRGEQKQLKTFVYQHPDIETQLDTLLLRTDNIATILDRKDDSVRLLRNQKRNEELERVSNEISKNLIKY